MSRVNFNTVVAVLLLGGVSLGGCSGDDAGTVIGTDAATTDATLPDATDAAPDMTTMDDVSKGDVVTDVPPDGVVDDGDVIRADSGDDVGDDAGDGGPVDGGTTDGGVGDGGDGGDAGALRGHPATAFVAAGSVMSSPSYRMVSTLGQSTIHQTVMRSTGYRLRGGLVGATAGSR